MPSLIEILTTIPLILGLSLVGLKQARLFYVVQERVKSALRTDRLSADETTHISLPAPPPSTDREMLDSVSDDILVTLPTIVTDSLCDCRISTSYSFEN